MLAGDLATDSKAYFGHGDAVGEEPMGIVVGSGSGALVMMMDAAHLGDLDHTTAIRWMNLSVLRTIHLQQLMRSPSGDTEMENPTSLVGEHQEYEEHPVVHSRYDEEIDGDNVLDVVLQKRPPGWRGWLQVTDHVPLYC